MTSIAEHYVGMRTQAHELRHQADLDDWVNRRAPSLGGGTVGVEQAVGEYFLQFKDRVIESAREYEVALAALRDDLPRLTPQERVQREAALPVPVYPAWSAKDEAGYLRVHGDPRNDASLFGMIQILGAPIWSEVIDSRPVQRAKTPWELTVLDALVHPRDGSVPIYPLDEFGNPVVDQSVLFRGTTIERPRMMTREEPGVGVEDLYGGPGAVLAGSGWAPPVVATSAPPSSPAAFTVPPSQPPVAMPAGTPVPSVELPPAIAANADPEFVKAVQKQMARAAGSICPHCYQSFQNLRSHEPACARKHGVEPTLVPTSRRPAAASAVQI